MTNPAWRREGNVHILAKGPYRSEVKSIGWLYYWRIDGGDGVVAEGRAETLESAKAAVEAYVAEAGE